VIRDPAIDGRASKGEDHRVMPRRRGETADRGSTVAVVAAFVAAAAVMGVLGLVIILRASHGRTKAAPAPQGLVIIFGHHAVAGHHVRAARAARR
jgi:hypothetical protein